MANGTGDGGKPYHESAFSIINTVTLIVVLTYAAYMPMWVFFPPTDVKPEVLAIINQMMGGWGYAFAAAIGFHIGSSRSAKDAQASNRDALQTLTGAAAPVMAATAPAVIAAAQAAAPAAAAAAAPAAAAAVAPAAAAEAAPPAANVAAPPAAEIAVDNALRERDEHQTGKAIP